MATIWRLSQCLNDSGKTRTPWYQDIAGGLMSKPVKLGVRAVGWPAAEVQAITAARIAGKSADEIRTLVAKLHAARKAVQ